MSPREKEVKSKEKIEEGPRRTWTQGTKGESEKRCIRLDRIEDVERDG